MTNALGNTFMDGKTRAFDYPIPSKPKQVFEQKIGAQVNWFIHGMENAFITRIATS